MRLYDFECSGNCWKVRLLLDMLGLDYERVPVDSSRGETQREAFKAVSGRGQIPVLEDGDVRLWDSQAILFYLARRYGGSSAGASASGTDAPGAGEAGAGEAGQGGAGSGGADPLSSPRQGLPPQGPWLPADPVGEAQVLQWLAVSENELLYGLARARVALKFGRPFDVPACQAEGRAGLAVLEARLAEHQWLVGAHATIADLACYPYVALAHEADVALDDYPAVRAWCARIAALPGYRPMG
jgi:Glutathione S-transferase